MTQPRLIVPGATYLLTRRTVLRYHLFAPDPRVRQIFLYTLAVAAKRTGVILHSVTLMSTHPHVVATDPEGRLPEFLHYLHRHVALAIKKLRNWEGAVWDHEAPSVVELRTPEAVVQEIGYSIANPAEAGLVARAADWPGVQTRPSDLGAAVWRVERPREYFAQDDDRWPPVVEVRLEMPRAVSELGITDEQFRELVAHEVTQLERAARAKREELGQPFLGVDRCRKLSPFRRSRSWEPLRSLNPCFAVGRGNREAFIEAARRLRDFRTAYRHARDAWRAGRHDVVLFPAGTWLMHRQHAAAVEPSTRAAA